MDSTRFWIFITTVYLSNRIWPLIHFKIAACSKSCNIYLQLNISFISYHGGQHTCPCFPEVPFHQFSVQLFFSSHLLLSLIIIVEAMVDGERRMNLFAITIVHIWKEICLAGDRTSYPQFQSP